MFEGTYLVTDKLQVFSDEDVDAAEAALGTRFPEGYREYVTTLGKGEYCGYIGVSLPNQIVADQTSGKPFLAEFCELWDGTEFGITPERLAQAIIIASSRDGDSIIFERDAHDAVYILPESEDIVYKAGPTLMDALTWLMKPRCSSPFHYFDSQIDQQSESVPNDLRLSLDKFRDWLIGLGKHDHLEEFWNDNPGVSMEMYRLLGGRMDLVVPELGQVMAFYKSFNGYVSASVDAVGNVSVHLVYDAEKSSDALKQITDYLQSKAA